jgi:DNA polymerase-3 subunit epsilon
MWSWRFWRYWQSMEHRRQTLLAKTPSGPLYDYLATPFTPANADIREIRFTALDFETTGLDPNQDELLSFGLVRLDRMDIQLGTAQHELIIPKGQIPESSAIIHEITDDQAAEGIELEQALEILLKRLAGTVLIAHYAKLELGFLDAACQRLYGRPFFIPTVDTLLLGRRWIENRNLYIQQSDLRLASLRTRFALPRYKAHNALTDAVATAELFLALTVQRMKEHQVPLSDFLL